MPKPKQQRIDEVAAILQSHAAAAAKSRDRYKAARNFLLAAEEEGKRAAYENAHLMVSNALVPSREERQAAAADEDLQRRHSELIAAYNLLNQVIEETTGISLAGQFLGSGPTTVWTWDDEGGPPRTEADYYATQEEALAAALKRLLNK